MKFYVSVAWRNLWRHGRRSLITATGMAVAVAFCMAMIAFNDGMYAQLFDVMVQQQLGHAQVHHPDYAGRRALHDTIDDADATVAMLRDLPDTDIASPRLNAFALVGGEAKSTGAQVVGVDPVAYAALTKVDTRLKSGTWLTPDTRGEMLLGQGLADDLGVAVGDEVVAVTQAADGSLGNELYTVRGTYRTGNTALDKAGGFVTLADAQQLVVLPDAVHEIVLVGDDPDDVDGYVAEARDALDGRDLEVKSWQEASPQTAQIMAMQDGSAVIVLGLVFAVAAFGILNTMLMSVFERTRELGVLKALGIRPSRLVILVLVESLFLAGVANAIGFVLGLALDAYLVWHGVDFSSAVPNGMDFAGVSIDPVFRGVVRPEMIVITLVAVFVVAALASLYPASRAASLQPVESLRAE